MCTYPRHPVSGKVLFLFDISMIYMQYVENLTLPMGRNYYGRPFERNYTIDFLLLLMQGLLQNYFLLKSQEELALPGQQNVRKQGQRN